MERFIRRENIKHYRELLRETKSAPERQRIQVLLDEELRKQKDAGDELLNPPVHIAGRPGGE